MSVSPRRQPPLRTARLLAEPPPAAAILRSGGVRSDDLIHALSLSAQGRGRVGELLVARGLVSDQRLSESLASAFGTGRADLDRDPPDPRLVDRFGAVDCLRHGLVPWKQSGAVTIVACPRPAAFAAARPRLQAAFGEVALSIAPRRAIDQAILALRGSELAARAEQRTPEPLSCRNYRRAGPAVLAATLAGLGLLAVLAPVPLLTALVGLAVLAMVLLTGLKLAALAAALRPPRPAPPPLEENALPVISIMVALFREEGIAPRLVRRLSRLDYPRDRLDILLVVEAEDTATRTALARADLPPWMRVVAVPDGQVKTKPRALNFALDLCRGSIVGVYDAEDAPDPDQLRKVAARFAAAPADVACLQGMLDFYNPATNWLSRCFTIEYGAWFRLVLPGLDRLRLPLPLGGTTLFFRRATLEEIGAWDAHNVTEDADLGIRLARHGLRTEVLDTVTLEEANCRALPWVKQRSRWIKGYMMTWATHMRDPRRLWRDLGPRGFAGFQILFFCTLVQFLLLPLLWSFWALPLGLPHPVAQALPPQVLPALTGLFLAAEVVTAAISLIGLARSGQRLSPLWVIGMMVYYPIGTIAAAKALWEMATQPFYWDKTSHGHFDGG